jgi:hypothetical protein
MGVCAQLPHRLGPRVPVLVCTLKPSISRLWGPHANDIRHAGVEIMSSRMVVQQRAGRFTPILDNNDFVSIWLMGLGNIYYVITVVYIHIFLMNS